jgi:hypothetical protein
MASPSPLAVNLPRIRVSDNHRFLVTEDGKPFFWLGDTAWELFHRLSLVEAELYLRNRAEKHFTVIQAVALAEFDGLRMANTNGDIPFEGNDPDHPNEAYFVHLDKVIGIAASLGLYIGLLPTWGDKVNRQWGAGPVIFTPENARRYGGWLGKRYAAHTNILWILGGDRPAVTETEDYREIWREMAAGIDEGSGRKVFKTYHPMGGASSSAWLHEEPWLDMNMMQSGHGQGHDVPVWEMVAHDYALQPAKPMLDGEPNYEDHPVNPWPKWDPANGYFRDNDVRKQIYRSVFAGACGVTYGHHSMWQFYQSSREPINYPDRDWLEALNRPGASQVQYLKALMESRPYLARIPDQSLLVSDPGNGGEHVQATRDQEGSYAFIYCPTSRPVRVELVKLVGKSVQASWYDPRSGQIQLVGTFPGQSTQSFSPPLEGPDWVLILDSQ